MLSQTFLHLINISIMASWLVLAIIIFRLVFKKAPKYIICALWALVAVRLIFPISIESPLSLIPSNETIPLTIEYSKTPALDTGFSSLDTTLNPIITDSFAPEDELTSMNPIQLPIYLGAYIWQLGIVIMLCYALISYIIIRIKVRERVKLDKNIYICDRIPSPFILGIIRPKIYLPSTLSEEESNHVISHEKAHIKRLDYIWKPLGFILLTIYWFNPILWIAYILLCRDIEYACDEKVIREMSLDGKKSYSETLLNLSIHRPYVTACPLAFGESGVKSRIKSVLNYKKPAFWIVMIAIILCIALAVCFLTNPVTNKNEDIIGTYTYMGTPDSISFLPYLKLYENNQFRFVYDELMNFIILGEYELTDKELILHSNRGIYTFTVDDDNFIFNAEKSDEKPSSVPDGARFIKSAGLSPLSEETHFDIDNDGIIEYCTLTMDLTIDSTTYSRVWTPSTFEYSLKVYENSQLEYNSDVFITGSPSFTVTNDKLMLQIQSTEYFLGNASNSTLRYLDINIIDGQITFTENEDMLVGNPENHPNHMIIAEDQINPSDMKDGMNDVILKEYYKQDIEDVMSMTTAKHIVIRYFEYDFNSDGLTDKFVIVASPLHSGSGGNSVDILINNGDGTYKNVSHYVMRILNQDSMEISSPIYISTQTNGYHDIIIFGEPPRTLAFNGEEYVLSF